MMYGTDDFRQIKPRHAYWERTTFLQKLENFAVDGMSENEEEPVRSFERTKKLDEKWVKHFLRRRRGGG